MVMGSENWSCRKASDRDRNLVTISYILSVLSIIVSWRWMSSAMSSVKMFGMAYNGYFTI